MTVQGWVAHAGDYSILYSVPAFDNKHIILTLYDRKLFGLPKWRIIVLTVGMQFIKILSSVTCALARELEKTENYF